MKFHHVKSTWVLAIILLLGLAASLNAVWAAPGQDPARQTIPTKTPTPLPVIGVPPPLGPTVPVGMTPVAPATLAPTATPVTPATSATPLGAGTPTPSATSAAGQPPNTLPIAGTTFAVLPWGLAGIGVLLALAGWLARRKASHRLK